MSTKRNGLEKVTVWLWERDLSLLRELYKGNGEGYQPHIRAAVAAMCDGLREALEARDDNDEVPQLRDVDTERSDDRAPDDALSSPTEV